MHFNRPIVDIIKHRQSVRTYSTEKLSKEIKGSLQEYASTIKGPFDAKIRMELVDAANLAHKTEGKIGTYGVIRGAKTYVAGVVSKESRALEQLGYSMERLMLYGASLGLGSCWLGGTFNRGQFAELVKLQGEEMIPAVTPIGYPADKRAIVDSIMRKLAGSDNRKPWNELFFNKGFDVPLADTEAGQYKTALEMLRLAPSASNKQPWRVVKDGDQLHFYLKTTKGYGNALGFNIQSIDIGIAMCHFEMTLQEAEIKGKWQVNSAQQAVGSEEQEYIISWITE